MRDDRSNPSDYGGVDRVRTGAWGSGDRDLVRGLESTVDKMDGTAIFISCEEKVGQASKESQNTQNSIQLNSRGSSFRFSLAA